MIYFCTKIFLNMQFDIKLIQEVYASYAKKIEKSRKLLGRPMTLAEKILYAHLYDNKYPEKPFSRGVDYVNFAPDRVAMQDATAQMALLQFMIAGKDKVAVPSSVHCDHLIQADIDARTDIAKALEANREVYDFLKDVSNKYGIGFWKPGAGIIHGDQRHIIRSPGQIQGINKIPGIISWTACRPARTKILRT